MFRSVFIALFVFVTAPLVFAEGWDPRNTAETSGESKLARRSQASLAGFLERDPSLQVFFDEAYGYVIFPRIGKGGLVVGYARGKGLIYRDGVAQGKAFMNQYSVGAQLGGRSYAELIFFRDQLEYDSFVDGNFSFRADAAAVISDDGAGTSTEYSNGIAVFTHERGGAMVDASLGGQRFRVEPFD
ncbi:MAG: lipid-binding SYLF domain-containing protein [Pseudomonadota bacterium]